MGHLFNNGRLAMKHHYLTLIAASAVFLGGCTPEVGSTQWCEALQEKPKGEWSMNEVRDFATNCIFPKAFPPAGSPEWCEEMKAKPKTEWSINDASEFATGCIFGTEDKSQ